MSQTKPAKKAKRKAVRPTFEVRFVGPDVSPDRVSLRHVDDALSAIQDLASGRDRFETSQVPPERSIGLVGVDSGSAVYKCVSHAPDEALIHLKSVAKCLEGSSNVAPEALVAALPPLESLSTVARLNGCRIELEWTKRRRATIFSVAGDDYDRLASSLLVEGETAVAGRLQRVGGATETKCALRVEGRRPLLDCEVEGRELSRRLGKHLYEEIVVMGTAVWLHQSWRIYRFRVRDFSQPRLGDTATMMEELREAGLSAWDGIDDPAAYVQELRG